MVKTVVKRFDIWLIEFDPTKGSEVKKTRPAVIISPDVMNTHLQTAIVAPLTSTIKSYPTRVNTNFDNKNGQIMLDQIRTVDKSRFKKKMGVLGKTEAKAVCQLLAVLFEE